MKFKGDTKQRWRAKKKWWREQRKLWLAEYRQQERINEERRKAEFRLICTRPHRSSVFGVYYPLTHTGYITIVVCGTLLIGAISFLYLLM